MDEETKDKVLKALAKYCDRTECLFCLFRDPVSEPCEFKKITGTEPCEWDIDKSE